MASWQIHFRDGTSTRVENVASYEDLEDRVRLFGRTDSDSKVLRRPDEQDLLLEANREEIVFMKRITSKDDGES